MSQQPQPAAVRFSHVQIFCDSLRPCEEYQKLQDKLNNFAGSLTAAGAISAAGELDVVAGRTAWLGLKEKHGDAVLKPCTPEEYSPVGQDVVEQLLVGVGWRVIGTYDGKATRSLALSSEDPLGAKLVVTAHKDCRLDQLISDDAANAVKKPRMEAEVFNHFDAAHLARFSQYHRGRQGVAVLGFAVPPGGVDAIRAKYAELHPKLLMPGTPTTYPGAKVLEVFAYYTGEKLKTDADPGTMIRFVELCEDASSAELCVLPGLKRVGAKYDGVSQSAFCDHWVSNVISREGFLDTLNDTLGFTPKVDFNAGVVAAGEAQIESTVTGNSSQLVTNDTTEALKDQSQVYLPINNALSDAGHVSIFLRELGQGVQHIASRVPDLSLLVQRANDYRRMTGAGFSFLQLPRSYYGYLTAKRLAKVAALDDALAERCVAALRRVGIVDSKDLVQLETTREAVAVALPKGLPADVVEHVMRARYGNLYALLKEHVSEETYLRIVRNNILVDIQGEDLLLQIFTSKVLQRKDGEEAPFFEFIQRICSQHKDPVTGCALPIKPGCGGFGIRNFLTLFLSIEVSKASMAKMEAEQRGDMVTAGFEARRVDAFTAQLDESNPILTMISDVMTAEGVALERGDAEEATRLAEEKVKGQQALQDVSARYKEVMRALREEQAAATA